MTREQALENLLNELPKEALIVTCNGKLGRELFELRVKRNEPNDDFIMVGSMGCAVAIGLGVALNTKKMVYVLTGDGNLIMKFGSVFTTLKYKPENFKIIVLDNGQHESTGGQPTASEYLPLCDYMRLISIEPGSRADLGRPTISPKEIKKNFMRKVKDEIQDNIPTGASQSDPGTGGTAS